MNDRIITNQPSKQFRDIVKNIEREKRRRPTIPDFPRQHEPTEGEILQRIPGRLISSQSLGRVKISFDDN
jgi:hypothetical protein